MWEGSVSHKLRCNQWPNACQGLVNVPLTPCHHVKQSAASSNSGQVTASVYC